MEVFRQHIIFRVFCCLLALHIFNISVDMPDANADDAPEDLSINDQETIVELILEKCIGIENAIAESDEPGDESQNIELTKVFKLYSQSFPQITFLRSYIEFQNKIPDKIIELPIVVSEITPPPPKA